MSNKQMISLQLNKELVAQIEKDALEKGLSRSAVVRLIIINYYKDGNNEHYKKV